MDDRDSNDRRGAAAPVKGSPADTGASPRPGADKDHFLRLMFFEASHRDDRPHRRPPAAGATPHYAPLRHFRARPGIRYTLPRPSTQAPVRLDSPATEVMTDLRQINAVTIDPNLPIDRANEAMIGHRVRALFVVEEARRVVGIITSTDVVSEKPIQFAYTRGIRHDEVLVRDIMTPAERLEIIDFNDLQGAHVGDVVATLKLVGRHHALVVETMSDAPQQAPTIRGIFSLTQIARQLGIAPQPIHDIARTFSEIEAVIAS